MERFSIGGLQNRVFLAVFYPTSWSWPRGHFCSGRGLPDCPFLDPILLSCAKKSGVEPPRRSCGGVAALRRSFNRGAAAPQTPRGFYICVQFKSRVPMSIVSTLVLVFGQDRFEAFLHNRSAEQQMSSLEPAKSKFPLEISLRRGFGGERSLSVTDAAPSQGLLQSKSAL